jgi:hypothetical protein
VGGELVSDQNKLLWRAICSSFILHGEVQGIFDLSPADDALGEVALMRITDCGRLIYFQFSIAATFDGEECMSAVEILNPRDST